MRTIESREHLIRFTRRFVMNQYDAERSVNHHDQGHWFEGTIDSPLTGPELANSTHICGTTGCVAGWGSLFAGWVQTRNARLLDQDDIDYYTDKHYWPELPSYIQIDKYGRYWKVEGSEEVVNPATGEIAGMMEAARQEFGLNEAQADVLFAGDNSHEEIDAMVDAFLANQDVNLREIRDVVRGVYDDA